MPVSESQGADQVWSQLEEKERQEVVNQVRQTVKEIIDEHFRISPNLLRMPGQAWTFAVTSGFKIREAA